MSRPTSTPGHPDADFDPLDRTGPDEGDTDESRRYAGNMRAARGRNESTYGSDTSFPPEVVGFQDPERQSRIERDADGNIIKEPGDEGITVLYQTPEHGADDASNLLPGTVSARVYDGRHGVLGERSDYFGPPLDRGGEPLTSTETDIFGGFGDELTGDRSGYYEGVPGERGLGRDSDYLLGRSAQEGVRGDAQARAAQMQALRKLQQYATGEFTEADTRRLMAQQDAQDAFANQAMATVQQSRLEQGDDSAGLTRALGAISGQGEVSRESDMALTAKQAIDQRALQSMAAAERLRGQMEAQRFTEDANSARAIDLFNRMNLDYSRGALQRDAERDYQMQKALAAERANQYNTNMGIYGARARESLAGMRDPTEGQRRSAGFANQLYGGLLGSDFSAIGGTNSYQPFSTASQTQGQQGGGQQGGDWGGTSAYGGGYESKQDAYRREAKLDGQSEEVTWT